MSLWGKFKSRVTKEIQQRKKVQEEISQMSDKELKQKAIRFGGAYSEAVVNRVKVKSELEKKIKEAKK